MITQKLTLDTIFKVGKDIYTIREYIKDRKEKTLFDSVIKQFLRQHLKVSHDEIVELFRLYEQDKKNDNQSNGQ